MNQAAAISSYSNLPLASLVESTTNPRRTFDPAKLVELAASIQANGLIQAITVRPLGDVFEIVAGARRFRAAQLAELEAIPVRILELSDAQALEVQIIENSQRQDVHPYEEAAGYQRLLDLPGYDAAALAAKCGKSPSHVYARLALLNLIPEAVEAFQEDRITAAHANLLARLTPEQQVLAFPQCWRKDLRDGIPHLLAARYLSAWIREKLYLPLATAPFNREDAELLPPAGSCSACPKRTGFNTALFCDFEDDQCLDPACYQAKIEAHISRELAADSNLVQIEVGWRPVLEQRPGSVHLNQLWPLREDSPQCDSVQRGIIVYGNGHGKTLTVCPREACPVHNQEVAKALADREREEEAARNAPQPTEEELREARETAERQALEAREREEQEALTRERRNAEWREAERRRAEEEETRRLEQEAAKKKREAKVGRIVKHTPENLSAVQLRSLLRGLLGAFDEGRFEAHLDALASEIIGDQGDNRRSAEEILAEAVAALPDKQVASFAIRLAVGWQSATPYLDGTDYLAEAEAVFLPKVVAGTGAKKQAATKRKA